MQSQLFDAAASFGALVLLTTAANAEPVVPKADAAAAASADPASNDIIVTASKRKERLLDVPTAITALGGDTLARLGAQTFRDYVSLVPGLSQRDLGNPGQGAFIIRGLNTGATNGSNTSAAYIDEVPFSASGFVSAGSQLTPDPDIAEVDRIEVLKGPQGTLYGANSLGGLIRIVSKRADVVDLKVSASAESTTVKDGDEGYAVRGSINVPLVAGKLAVRINGVYRRAPGWTDNVFTNTQNLNDSIVKGARVAVRFVPVDDLFIDLTGLYQDIDNKGYAFQDNATGTLTPLYGDNKYSNRLNFGSQIRYRVASGVVDYNLGSISLNASASYARYLTDNSVDQTDTFVKFIRTVSPPIGLIIPADAIGRGDFSPNMNKFSAEVRAVSKRLGRFEFVAGGFFTDEQSLQRTIVYVLDANGVPLAAPNNVLVRAQTLSNYREIAGFGNLTYYLNDHFDATGGVRVAHNSQKAQTGGPGAVTFFAPRAIANFNFADDVATYLATARWRPSSTVSFYIRAASGYRPGGPQTNPAPPPGAQTSVRPDTTWNYEGGIKANLGKGFSLNAAVYHIDWKDIQLSTTVGGVVLQGNGGNAKVDGFELEAGARPTRLLSFTASVGYTDARITQISDGARKSVGANTGDKLPLTPKYTIALIGDQIIPIDAHVQGDIGATLRFRSDMPSSYPFAILNPNVKIPSLTTIDLRAGLNFGRVGVQLRAENILDEHGFTSASTGLISPAVPVPTVATVIRPRALTLAVSTAF